jgi:hypothetical protein
MKQTRINRKEALILYSEKTGREISYHGLFYLAKSNYFLKRDIDGFHYCYLKEKMVAYLEQILKPIPKGYLKIKQLAEKYDLSYSGVNYLVKVYKLKPLKCGNRKINVFNEKEFQKIVK